jgi:16S rRNA processing protein RimM
MKLVVGRVGRAHGIRGDVTVDVRTDEPDARFVTGAVLQTDPPGAGPLTIDSARRHSGGLLVRFAGVADRSAAEALRGTVLMIDSSQVAPPEDPDEFHDSQLLGLRAEAPDGTELGRVTDVLHHAQDVLVITRQDGGEVLVPFVRRLVPRVEPAAGTLVIDPPPGLLEL